MQHRERPQTNRANEDPDAFFARHGFKLRVKERNLDAELPRKALSRGSTHLADLISLRSDEVIAPSYGSGMNEDEARRRAMQRYIEEQ